MTFCRLTLDASMEETRVCNSCGQVFPLTHDYFNYRDKGKGQFQGMCRECRRAYIRGLMEDPERKAKAHESNKRYYQTHKEQEKERGRIKNARLYWGNAELYKEKSRKYREENPQKCRETHRRYAEKNGDKIAEYESAYKKNRYHNDPLFKFQCRLRNTINQSFTRYETYKPRKNKDVIGMTSAELREYLLRTYAETYGYEWDKVEPVHIDHIIPLSTAETQEDIARLCHYTNLRLLKAHDNLSKGASLDYQIGGNP